MKKIQKLLCVAVLLIFSNGAFAQTSNISLLGKLGYQTDFERFGIELGGRYEVAPQLRIAPAVSFLFPKNHTLGFNVDLNVQYAFSLPNTELDLYPLMGLNMSNNDFDPDVKVDGQKVGYKWTKWGYNLGFGADYYLTSSDFLNFEFKYTFGGDFATVMLGYGYKF